jgi:hypothetical protein
MSSGARVFQILFVVLGLPFIGLGLLGVTTESQNKTIVNWSCQPAQDDAKVNVCSGGTSADNNNGAATAYILVGIGLEIAAGAIAAGSRETPRPFMPAAYPQPYPSPGVPVGPPAPHSAPPRPAGTAPF